MIDKQLWFKRAKEILDEIMVHRTTDLEGFLIVQIDQNGTPEMGTLPAGPAEIKDLYADFLRDKFKRDHSAGYVIISECWLKVVKTEGLPHADAIKKAEEMGAKSLRHDPERQDAFSVIIGDEAGTEVKAWLIKPGSRRLRVMEDFGFAETAMIGRFNDLIEPAYKN